MSGIAQQALQSYRRLLVGWFRLQEKLLDYFNLSRRLSLLILLLGAIQAYLLARTIMDESWLLLGLLVIGFLVLPVLALRPEWIVVSVAFLVASLISPVFWDTLALAERGVTLPNILVLYGLLILLFRLASGQPVNSELWKTPTTVAITVFLILTVITGFLYHVIVMELPYRKELAELEHMILWLTYYLVLGLCVDERRLRHVQIGILLVAALGAVPTILQAIFGPERLFFLKLTQRDIRIVPTEGLTRVIPLGENLITVTFLISWQMMIASRGAKRLGWGLLGTLYGFALLMTLTRHVWFGVLFALAILWLLSDTRTKVITAIAAALLSSVIASVVLLARPAGGYTRDDFFSRISRRFLSTFAEDPQQHSFTRHSSVGQRVYEMRTIMQHWAQSPWLGYGWSTRLPLKIAWEPYRGKTVNPVTYVHNSFWWILGKGGIVGAAGLLLLCITGIIRGYQLYRRAVDPFARAWLLALWGGFFAIIVAAQFEPVFWVRNRLIAVALTLAFAECVYYFSQKREPVPTPSTEPAGYLRNTARR